MYHGKTLIFFLFGLMVDNPRKVGKDNKDVIPLEVFEVAAGQFAKIELNTEQRKNVVEFSTKRPNDRFRELEDGFQVRPDNETSEYDADIQQLDGQLWRERLYESTWDHN